MVRVPFIFQLSYRPHRLAWPRTLPFQGSNTGSNPVGDTNDVTRNTITEAILQQNASRECSGCH